MVLGVISLVATVPLIATGTLTLQDSAQQQQVSSEEAALKTEKCSIRLRATSRMNDERKRIVANRQLTLFEKKLCMDDDSQRFHRFAGYFLPYPGRGYDGLVSTINSENMLNWIYVDAETYEVKYGVREEAEKNLPGPWGIVSRTALSEIRKAEGGASVERRLVFRGWEGFVLVEEKKDAWALYFDMDDDGLKGKMEGKRVTEVELCRVPLIAQQTAMVNGKETHS